MAGTWASTRRRFKVPLVKTVRRPRLVVSLLFLGTVYLFYSRRGKGTSEKEDEPLSHAEVHARAAAMSAGQVTFDTSPRTPWTMGPPDFTALRATTRNVTVWLLPGAELRCTWQYNYFCKFYYAIRCHMLGGFENVRIATGIPHVQEVARDGDVVIVAHRHKKHAEPHALIALNHWRRYAPNAPEFRIGVFHVANEVERAGWDWYVNADFVLRNYWLPGGAFPGHVQFIPLHHQMPSVCTPESPLDAPKALMCTCNRRGLPRAPERPKLYSFSGSLRRGRSKLLSLIRKSKRLRRRGTILVSKHFGGDGEDPKARHVAAMLEAVFVFSPCGNVMETHRIYEALALGAIPVIQNCEDESTNAFFPLRELVFDTHEEMVQFVESFIDDELRMQELQAKVLEWWVQYNVELATNVTRIATVPTPKEQIFAP